MHERTLLDDDASDRWQDGVQRRAPRRTLRGQHQRLIAARGQWLEQRLLVRLEALPWDCVDRAMHALIRGQVEPAQGFGVEIGIADKRAAIHELLRR